MLKKYKTTIILSTLVLLLPVLIGLALWNTLPDTVPIHWNAAGEIDGWGSKGQLVFLMPGFMLAMHWVCILATRLDPKTKNIDGKMMHLALWICPFISLAVCTLIYAAALGHSISVEVWLPLTMGGLFLIIGNLLPKCKQNYSVGIKISWTLHDEGNWNATHRFAGWVWVIGGAVIMATSILGNVFVFLAITLAMAFAPIIYTYLYYRKHKNDPKRSEVA